MKKRLIASILLLFVVASTSVYGLVRTSELTREQTELHNIGSGTYPSTIYTTIDSRNVTNVTYSFFDSRVDLDGDRLAHRFVDGESVLRSFEDEWETFETYQQGFIRNEFDDAGGSAQGTCYFETRW